MSGYRFRIHFYRTAHGRCQPCDYSKAMKQDHRDKAGDWFRLLARMGPRLPVNYGKYLRDGVWELRVAIEHHQHRFLFSFLKKSREVPDQEIERSRKNMAEFIRRQGWEEI